MDACGSSELQIILQTLPPPHPRSATFRSSHRRGKFQLRRGLIISIPCNSKPPPRARARVVMIGRPQKLGSNQEVRLTQRLSAIRARSVLKIVLGELGIGLRFDCRAFRRIEIAGRPCNRVGADSLQLGCPLRLRLACGACRTQCHHQCQAPHGAPLAPLVCKGFDAFAEAAVKRHGQSRHKGQTKGAACRGASAASRSRRRVAMGAPGSFAGSLP